MKKYIITAAAVMVTGMTGASAFAQTAPAAAQSSSAAPAEAYSVETSLIGDLLDNPDTKAIVAKYLPDVVNSPQIDMARSMTLRQIQSYAPDTITDDLLAKIEADLKKLPVKKSS